MANVLGRTSCSHRKSTAHDLWVFGVRVTVDEVRWMRGCEEAKCNSCVFVVVAVVVGKKPGVVTYGLGVKKGVLARQTSRVPCKPMAEARL